MAAARRGEEWDPSGIDRIAERQRTRLAEQGAAEADPVRVYKLRCQGCLVLIGPGYAYDEVWLDLARDRWICRSCALWPSVARSTVRPLADRDEVAALSIGELGRLMRSRSREIKRGSRR